MGEQPQNIDSPAPPDTAEEAAAASLLTSLQVSDRISLAAVATAAIALLVGIVQTMFMWSSRNDEVEAALRAAQVRACVAYRISAVDANERAQMIAANGETTEEREEFDRVLTRYRTAIGELGYLLPQTNDDGLSGVDAAVVAAYNAYLAKDYEELAQLSRADSAWSQAHNDVLEACERVIRDVRDQ